MNHSSVLLMATSCWTTLCSYRLLRSRTWHSATSAFLFSMLMVALNGICEDPKKVLGVSSPIDISGFSSSIHHWRNIRDNSRFILVEEGQGSYASEQVREIAENILLFQREDGGWPKDYDMTAILSDAQKERILATRSNHDSSYDNGNLHSQVEYLARAYSQTRDHRYRTACERGLDFMFASQYPHGGFPQRFPNPKSYYAHITLNDGVMIGIVEVLRSASRTDSHFTWLDERRRQLASDAVDQSMDCLLRCQIVVDGKKTGWCQQHDEIHFEARPARTFELASICPQETSSVIRFMMSEKKVTPAMHASIEAAIAWLQAVRINGLRVERIAAKEETFLRHKANFDVVTVQDPEAKPIWARHYEIGTNRPIFAGRDGVKKYSLQEIERERRTGSSWYGYWPESALREFEAWRQKK